jgi:hypothetical protein
MISSISNNWSCHSVPVNCPLDLSAQHLRLIVRSSLMYMTVDTYLNLGLLLPDMCTYQHLSILLAQISFD